MDMLLRVPLWGLAANTIIVGLLCSGMYVRYHWRTLKKEYPNRRWWHHVFYTFASGGVNVVGVPTAVAASVVQQSTEGATELASMFVEEWWHALSIYNHVLQTSLVKQTWETVTRALKTIAAWMQPVVRFVITVGWVLMMGAFAVGFVYVMVLFPMALYRTYIKMH